MNSEAERFDIEIGRNWPEQIIVDHAPYWRAWRRHADPVEPKSQEIYRVVGRSWIAFANGKNIGPRLMMDWMRYVTSKPALAKTAKAAGACICNRRVEKYRYIVGSYLRWLHLMGAITQNPSDCMPKVRPTPPSQKLIFTHEEYLRMVEYGRQYGSLDTQLWLLTLGYHTGMSLIDCCTLRWEQVELPEDGPCFIRRMRSKLAKRYGTKCMCTIPIIVGSELWVWFKQLQRKANYEGEEAGIDFVHQEAAEMSITYPPQPTFEMSAFIKAALGADQKNRTFRNLRNTFASRLINSGTDSVLVSKMTGHKTVAQLADYVVPDQGAMQEAILKGIRFVEGKTILPAEKKSIPESIQQTEGLL